MAVDAIGPVLREYVTNALAVLDPVPDHVIYAQPGQEVAWDDCCSGQLYARIVQIDPAPATAATIRAKGLPCGIPWMNVMVGLGVLRCVAVVNDKGKAPTPEQISADGQQMLDDIAALQEVMLCTGRTSSVFMWVPLGPQGGCAGGEWQFVVRVPTCACPDPAPWEEPEP